VHQYNPVFRRIQEKEPRLFRYLRPIIGLNQNQFSACGYEKKARQGQALS